MNSFYFMLVYNPWPIHLLTNARIAKLPNCYFPWITRKLMHGFLMISWGTVQLRLILRQNLARVSNWFLILDYCKPGTSVCFCFCCFYCILLRSSKLQDRYSCQFGYFKVRSEEPAPVRVLSQRDLWSIIKDKSTATFSTTYATSTWAKCYKIHFFL